jgi:hypothetical protein
MAFAIVPGLDFAAGPTPTLGKADPSQTMLLWLTATILLLIAFAAMAGQSPSQYEPVSGPLAALRRRR